MINKFNIYMNKNTTFIKKFMSICLIDTNKRIMLKSISFYLAALQYTGSAKTALAAISGYKTIKGLSGHYSFVVNYKSAIYVHPLTSNGSPKLPQMATFISNYNLDGDLRPQYVWRIPAKTDLSITNLTETIRTKEYMTKHYNIFYNEIIDKIYVNNSEILQQSTDLIKLITN